MPAAIIDNSLSPKALLRLSLAVALVTIAGQPRFANLHMHVPGLRATIQLLPLGLEARAVLLEQPS